MIIFVCPKPLTPSGGVAFIHQLVRLLNEAGESAKVLQEEPFEVWWEANPIPADMVVTEIDCHKEDVLVVPEVLWHKYEQFPTRKLCFVQNYIWSPPIEPDVPLLTCSRFLVNFAHRMWHTQTAYKVTPYLEDGVWSAQDKEKDRVVLLARRNTHHSAMYLLLKENGFNVDYITEPVSQRELAVYFGRAEYYVHLTHPEGFPLICLEAMRSKALVVGTTGGGGNEFMFHRETALVVQDPENGRYDNGENEFQKRIIAQMLEVRNNIIVKPRMAETAYDWSLRYTAKRATTEILKALHD